MSLWAHSRSFINHWFDVLGSSEIPIGIPDESSRLEILKVLSRDLNLVPNFDLRQLARLTPGYVGSDLKALLREAAVNCLNRILLQVCLSTSRIAYQVKQLKLKIQISFYVSRLDMTNLLKKH